MLVDLGLAVKFSWEWFYLKCGTYGYIAPEVMTAREKADYNEKIDIFSAGCILYYLLKGVPLFEGKCKEEISLKNKFF